jgi:hypothetical protein
MENESNKTAIDQMFDIIEGLAEYSPENPMLQSLIAAKPRLKEVEKQQIENAYEIGIADALNDAIYDDESTYIGAEQYYEQTYGGNK